MADHRASRWSGSGKRSVQAGSARRATVTAPAAVTTEPEATAAAKELAAEHNIDLTAVEGTGAEGRITKDDVASAIAPEPEPEPEPEEDDETDDEPETEDVSAQQQIIDG